MFDDLEDVESVALLLESWVFVIESQNSFSVHSRSNGSRDCEEETSRTKDEVSRVASSRSAGDLETSERENHQLTEELGVDI